MEDFTVNKYKIDSAAKTMCGPNRSENQDVIVLNKKITQNENVTLKYTSNLVDSISFAVVDGMGGYDGGVDAALLASCDISRYDLIPDNVEASDLFCNSLSTKILRAGQAWGTPKMGAAFCMLTINDQNFSIVNIGDCRIYRYDEEDDFLTQLSIDDTSTHGGLMQSLGCIDEQLESHAYSDFFSDNDQFLLCTDGVWKTLNEDILCQIILNASNSTQVVSTIMNLCNRNNAKDNCSACFVKITPIYEAV